MTRLRVAFFVAPAASWLGGANYVSNLVRAVAQTPDSGLEPVIVTPPGISPPAALTDVPCLQSPLVAGRRPTRIAAKLCERWIGRNLPMERLLRSEGVGVLSHSGSLGRRSRLPTIGWAPDFQHRRMPEFFSRQELARRDANLRQLIKESTVLVVSSQDAQRDLANFEPAALGKSRILHFVSGLGIVGEAHAVEPLAPLQARYGFLGPYLHLPNQFWRHKNHKVVVEALAILRGRGRPVTVVSTGHTHDHRHPTHFEELMRSVAEHGLADDFRVLGVVPYADLRALMHHATAVMNPSLFEGWSTTVEEAKSAGKIVILSDIPVHREQDPARGMFFDPSSAEMLADTITRAFEAFDEAEEARRRAAALTALNARYHAFGRRYAAIALEAAAAASG